MDLIYHKFYLKSIGMHELSFKAEREYPFLDGTFWCNFDGCVNFFLTSLGEILTYSDYQKRKKRFLQEKIKYVNSFQKA